MPNGSTRPIPTPLPPTSSIWCARTGGSWRRRAGCGASSATATGCGKNWSAPSPRTPRVLRAVTRDRTPIRTMVEIPRRDGLEHSARTHHAETVRVN